MREFPPGLNHPLLLRAYQAFQNRMDERRWLRNGCPVPPPEIRLARNVADTAGSCEISVLVEWGTGTGWLTLMWSRLFREVFTMDSDVARFQRAHRIHKHNPQVHCYDGRGPDVLRSLLARIGEPCVFLLNAPGPNPATGKQVLDMVDVLSDHRRRDHLILFPHAHLYDGSDGFPSLDTLQRKCADHGYGSMCLREDLILFSADPLDTIPEGEPSEGARP